MQGPTGATGMQGPTGATGMQGPTGATGTSYLTLDASRNIYYTQGSLAIGKTPIIAGPYALDISGNTNVSNVSYVSKISEGLNTLVAFTPPVTIDCSTNSVFYYSAAAQSGPYTLNFTNVPSVLNKSLVLTVIYQSTSGTPTYANSVTINGGSAITPQFNGGNPPTLSITTSPCTTVQSFSILFNALPPTIVLSTIAQYQ
jgi:hypothetical protein